MTRIVLLLVIAAFALPLWAAELGDDGLHKTAWMRDTFKDLNEDLAEASGEGKRLAIIIEQRGCIYCTKMHEEVRRGSAGDLAQWAQGEIYGEITLVLGPGAAPAAADDAAVDAALRRCLQAGMSTKDAAAAVAAVLEVSKRDAYQRCQALKG